MGELGRRVEQADLLNACVNIGKCPLLDIIEALSDDAKRRLVEVNPANKTQIIQYQQTAKLFDAVVMTIENKLREGKLAADELNDIEEGNDGG